MSEKAKLRAVVGAGLASVLVAVSAAGALADESTDPAEQSVGSSQSESATPGTTETSEDKKTGEQTATESPTGSVEKTTGTDENTSSESPSGSASASESELASPSGSVTESVGNDDAEETTSPPPPPEVIPPSLDASASADMKVNAEWKVTKKVTSKVKKVTGKPGSTVKVPYRVEASAKGVIRDLKVTGQMSVTNKDARDLTYTLEAILLNGPHDADGMPIEEAMRSVNGSKCTFNAKDADPNKPGHQVVVASGQSLNVKYNCTSDDGWFDAAEINTAPYSFWTYLKAMTAMGFEKEAASWIYAPVDASGVKVQDAVVNVWDFNSDADGGDAFELGKADASKGKAVFDYTMNVTIPTVKCYDYVNNAIVSGADGDALALDAAVVEACPEAPKAAVKPAGAVKDGVNAGAAAATTGSGESGLAATGAESTMLGAIGAALLAIGGLTVGLARRARKA